MLGETLGDVEGREVVGLALGALDGCIDGTKLGEVDGVKLGVNDGREVVGTALGELDGDADG